jgi:outer membrane protein OmpA-like peptidoglycan-associated protein
MKIKVIIFSSFAILSTIMFSQNKQITLSDTNLSVNCNYTTRQIYFDLGLMTLKPESSITLDSIVNFIKSHDNIIFEIGVHSDTRTRKYCCSRPTEQRAQSIYNYLIDHGAKKENLKALGYGTSKLLISDKEILKAKTKDIKDSLHTINRRIVVTVINIKQ